MIRGSCLCGGVTFEIARCGGPFELCHCSRCRKVSGSAFMAGVAVRREDFRLLTGADLIREYEAPLRVEPPAYRVSFCARCGSPVPDPNSTSEFMELAAGLLDDDPGVRPQRHIFVECKARWDAITDGLPALNEVELREFRKQKRINKYI